MSSVETIVIFAALAALAGGGLILLHSLATHRRHLFQALKIEMDIESREELFRQQQEKIRKKQAEEGKEEVITVGGAVP